MPGERRMMDDAINGFVAQIEHPTLRQVVEYWLAKRGDRRVPLRADIDPLDLHFALGYISLVEVRENPRRFFFRVDGSMQVELFGIDCTGKYLDECFPPDHVRMTTASYGAAVDTGQPQYHRRRIIFDHRPLRYEVAILPLSSGADIADMLLVALIPNWD